MSALSRLAALLRGDPLPGIPVTDPKTIVADRNETANASHGTGS